MPVKILSVHKLTTWHLLTGDHGGKGSIFVIVPKKMLNVINYTGREYRKSIALQSDLMGKGIIRESEVFLLGPRFVVFIY